MSAAHDRSARYHEGVSRRELDGAAPSPAVHRHSRLHHLGHAALHQGTIGAITGTAIGGLGLVVMDQLRHEARFRVRHMVDGALSGQADRRLAGWAAGGLAAGLLLGTAIGYGLQPDSRVRGATYAGRIHQAYQHSRS
jgi:hypothetical protein